jgi:hypothetical protein
MQIQRDVSERGCTSPLQVYPPSYGTPKPTGPIIGSRHSYHGVMSVQPPKWREMWDRVQRWYERFAETDQGRTHDRPSDFYQDEAYAFFIACFHLKDWLKNDPLSSAVATDVEQLVANSPNLRLCADLCNGSKHLILTSPRVDAATQIGRRHLSVGISESIGPSPAPAERTTISAKYEIHAAGKAYDAFQVATACRDEWEQYLKRKGLL